MMKAAATLLAATTLLTCAAAPCTSALAAPTVRVAKLPKPAKVAKPKKAQVVEIEKPRTVIPMDAVRPVLSESLIGQRYVAIGSSFAAGPQLPPAKPSWPARCGQSQNNYPTLLAEQFGLELIDRSCSGAVTDNVLGPWGEVPPQINSVTPETRLVTITMGGNDLSYIGNLFSATCAHNARLAAPGTKSKGCGPVRVPTEADYVRDEAQLTEIVRRIRATAPQARVVFVQYLTPLPQPGKLCADTPVSETDAAIVREIGKRLSEITARVAEANGTIIVGMDRSSATHTPCDREPWMIGSPAGYDGRQGLQWHLNKTGMQATADGIATLLIKDGVQPARPAPAVKPGSNPPGQQPTRPAPGQPVPAVPVPATGNPPKR
ncbi:SGNH/GDSL hydrolase family protein [Novosphingobium gossypii]|uniref:SGNH/GDSL hydrolase family protein n=1 Tax=Novosphingobium gossypii TaxID=1604774 RepID=UPI003D1EC4DA